jgi:hypothetical protein
MVIIKFQFPAMILNYVLLCVIAEEGKQKPKRNKAKQFNRLNPAVKKTKVQAANNEGKDMTSEATGNISKIRNNKVQENNSSNRPDQTSFSSAIYTQELSSKESENLNEKPFTEARSKPLLFESTTEISQKDSARQDQDASSPTKPENVSLPKCKQPSTNIERQTTVSEMQIPSDDGSETQIRVASKQGEDIINCSQDLFSSQVGPIEENMSQTKNVDTDSGTTVVQGLSKSSISGRANSRNVNGPCEENKTNKITVDSCMATSVEAGETEQVKTISSLIRVVEHDTGNMMESGGALIDNDTAMTEVDTSKQSDLQLDISTMMESGGALIDNNTAMAEADTSKQSDLQLDISTMMESGGALIDNDTAMAEANTSKQSDLQLDISTMMESGGALIDDTAMTEVDTSVQSVLQLDISNPTTSIAPTFSQSNCSDSVPLVPDSQFKTVCTKAGQLIDQNLDAVVPELNVEDFDNNSYDSIDFEPEE